MDVVSGPLYQHDRDTRTRGVRARAWIALAILLLAGLCLLGILGGASAGLPPEPASESVLVAPLRWS
jgi:hypothetical protein